MTKIITSIMITVVSVFSLNTFSFAADKQETLILNQEKTYFDEKGQPVNVTCVQSKDIADALDLEDEILLEKALHSKVGSCSIKTTLTYLDSAKENFGYAVLNGTTELERFTTIRHQVKNSNSWNRPDPELAAKALAKLRLIIQAGICG